MKESLYNVDVQTTKEGNVNYLVVSLPNMNNISRSRNCGNDGTSHARMPEVMESLHNRLLKIISNEDFLIIYKSYACRFYTYSAEAELSLLSVQSAAEIFNKVKSEDNAEDYTLCLMVKFRTEEQLVLAQTMGII